MDAPPGLDAAVDELYGLDPADFVARRDELAKQARLAKDRPLANAIKALRRPTVGAWYVNVASRAHLLSLKELLELGRRLRAAQAAQDFQEVVALGPRRADLERRVLGDLTAHLAQLGVTATPAALDEVRSTLRATLADTEAADAVASGHLDRPLAYGDLGDGLAAALSAMTGTAPPATPEASPDRGGATEPEDSEPAENSRHQPVPESTPALPPADPAGAEYTEDAEAAEDEELAELDRRARAAEEALRASQVALEELQRERKRLSLRRDLQTAERRVADAARRRDEAAAVRDEVARQLSEAEASLDSTEGELTRARADLARLQGGTGPAGAV